MSDGKRRRNKGARFEREVVNYYRNIFGRDAAKRGLQSRRGEDAPDVLLLSKFHIECKRSETTNIWAAIRQAKSDCSEDRLPVVVAKKTGSKPIVAMPIGVFDVLVRHDRMILELVRAIGKEDGARMKQIIDTYITSLALGWSDETWTKGSTKPSKRLEDGVQEIRQDEAEGEPDPPEGTG